MISLRFDIPPELCSRDRRENKENQLTNTGLLVFGAPLFVFLSQRLHGVGTSLSLLCCRKYATTTVGGDSGIERRTPRVFFCASFNVSLPALAQGTCRCSGLFLPHINMEERRKQAERRKTALRTRRKRCCQKHIACAILIDRTSQHKHSTRPCNTSSQ